jgi:glycosyltransferase involved in cell wall biosynthesis
VYIKYLSKALSDLGHKVDVLSGPPYPELSDGIRLHKIPGLDLYNPEHLFKPGKFRDLASLLNIFEFVSMSTGGFPEPFTFGVRARRYLSRQRGVYDIVHDNQGLSYGLLGIAKEGFPLVATVHHPIAVDRNIELEEAGILLRKIKVRRWYSFLRMQKKVIKKIPYIITVSGASKSDIAKEFKIPEERFRIVSNGINTDNFRPVEGIKRPDNRIITTTSADTPLKGLKYLLLAFAEVRRMRDVSLTVIGKPKKNGTVERLVSELTLEDSVQFTGRIAAEEFPRYYARATMAVIPSLYEGFGMPAGEAMACGVPVISTTGGALPEVIGDAGMLIPPGNIDALVHAILTLLDNPGLRRKLAEAGMARVNNSLTWSHAAEKTVAVYREAIDAYRGF